MCEPIQGCADQPFASQRGVPFPTRKTRQIRCSVMGISGAKQTSVGRALRSYFLQTIQSFNQKILIVLEAEPSFANTHRLFRWRRCKSVDANQPSSPLPMMGRGRFFELSDCSIRLLILLLFFSFRFSLGLSSAFFCCSLLPLSLLPLSPLAVVSPGRKRRSSRREDQAA
jgi:hypothetical protein